MIEEEKKEDVTEESAQVQESEQVTETTAPAEQTEQQVTEETELEEKTEKAEKEQKTREKKQKQAKAEEKESDFDKLSDDEKYARIQTEKLLQKRKKRQIFTLCGLCVAFALALTLIVLACVPVSLKPSCISDGYMGVTLYPNSTNFSGGLYLSDSVQKEKYEEFSKLYNDAFSQTCLNAIFSNSIGKEKVFEGVNESRWNDTDTLREIANGNKRIVQFQFAESKLLKVNGKTFSSSRGGYTDWAEGELYYEDAYLVVNETAGMTDTDVYVVVKYPFDNSGNSYYLKITVKADTHNLYEAWGDLLEN